VSDLVEWRDSEFIADRLKFWSSTAIPLCRPDGCLLYLVKP